jgi:hypothetical protein
MRSYFAASILPGMAFSRFDRITCWRKSSGQTLLVGVTLNVGGRRRLRSTDPIQNRQTHEDKETAYAIDRPPRQTTHRFEHRVAQPARRSRVAEAFREKILAASRDRLQLQPGSPVPVSSRRCFRLEPGHIRATAPFLVPGVGHRKHDLTRPLRRPVKKHLIRL